MHFPQYRKRFDNQAFYKITSVKSFVEIQQFGSRFTIYELELEKYFEQLQIQDMLNISIELYEMSSQEEFEEIEQKAKEFLSEK